jgi:hypothetical protein
MMATIRALTPHGSNSLCGHYPQMTTLGLHLRRKERAGIRINRNRSPLGHHLVTTLNGPPPSTKGKGSPIPKKQLWCDYHQAYGHSTDWCFSNPNRTGGPPKQDWCNHHQSYGHSTEACRKGNGAPIKDDPSRAQQKGGKGKSKGNFRAWKSDNFPASYDQATPAISESKIIQWWDNEEELSSVCVHSASTDVNLTVIDDSSSFSEDLDEASADLLDLHFLSIIHQHERMQQFLLHPDVALQEEITTHEAYIVFANSLLDPEQQK